MIEIRRPNGGPVLMVRWHREGKVMPETKVYANLDAATERVASLQAQGLDVRVWRGVVDWQEVDL